MFPVNKKARFIFVAFALSTAAHADQLQDRVNRAEAISKAEEMHKLCDLGSPECSIRSTSQSLPTPAQLNAPMPLPQGAIKNGSKNPSPAPIMAPIARQDVPAKPAQTRPIATGAAILDGVTLAEIRWNDTYVMVPLGGVIGGWRITEITSKGVGGVKETAIRVSGARKGSKAAQVRKSARKQKRSGSVSTAKFFDPIVGISYNNPPITK